MYCNIACCKRFVLKAIGNLLSILVARQLHIIYATTSIQLADRKAYYLREYSYLQYVCGFMESKLGVLNILSVIILRIMQLGLLQLFI